MSKSGISFQETYDKTIKFYDFQYHLHKSTFKGLSAWMKQYSQIQKNYADKLFSMSKNIKQYIPDSAQQLAPVGHSLTDLTQCVSTYSQLHHNYSERLLQVSNSLMSEYNSSKRAKEKHMKILRDISQEKLQKARQSRNKQLIVENQMQTCKKLFEHLDTYADQQLTRVQKVKEQLLIFLSLTKKIQQKNLQTTTKFKSKITQQEIQLKSPQLQKVSEMIVACYNYISEISEKDSQKENKREKLVSKNFQMNKKVQILRESLKQSTLFRQKVGRMDNFKERLTLTLKDYERIPQSFPEYNLIKKQTKIQGLFDCKILKNTHKYANLINTVCMKKISYSMLSSFYNSSKVQNSSSIKKQRSLNSGEIKTLLLTIKANLKLRGEIRNQGCKSLEQFIQRELKQGMDSLQNKNSEMKREYGFHVGFLIILSKIYSDSQQSQQGARQNDISGDQKITQTNLLSYISAYLKKPTLQNLQNSKCSPLHPTVSHVIIKTLLQSIVTLNTIHEDDQPILADNFVEIVEVIQRLGQEWLGIQKRLVRLMSLEVIQNVMKCVKGKFVEQLHLLVEGVSSSSKAKGNENNNRSNSDKKQLYEHNPFQQSLQNLQNYIVAKILTSLTPAITSFYTLPIPLINYFCIIICIEKLSSVKSFSAVEYFHKCIKRAGYSYIFWIDEQKKIIEPMIWQGEMRLKNMVDILQQMQYKKLEQTHFLPTAEVMAPILGVDERIILRKLKQQLLLPLGDILEENISLLQNQKGIDKQGYILKLGVLIAQMDIAQYRSQQFIKKYFTVLEMYLSNTQVEYNTLLEHSRKTQLWIIEQNRLATANCVDFCSLLYKPFEFLLKTIKQIAVENRSEFTIEFSQFIKKKLNTILKQQIVKYINFLYDSLRQYSNGNTPSLHYKPTSTQSSAKLLQITQQHSHHIKMTFIQSTKRIYNLNFLKSQLNEIVNDFLDQHVLEQLGHDVFCLERLVIAVAKYKQHKEILCNLKDIVETISSVQEKIIHKVSAITVHNCMSRLFMNLYYQEEKSAFQEFFSTKQDYTFSKYTFVYYQKQFEDIFIMIRKNLPEEIQEKFYPQMLNNFFNAIKFQLLNTAKFKLPKSKEDIVRFVDEDCSFISTMIKQRFIQPDVVHNYLEKPLKNTLSLIKSPTKDLIQKFETQTLNNNNQECKAILIILYMRNNDEKAQQFFKKFKNVVFK